MCDIIYNLLCFSKSSFLVIGLIFFVIHKYGWSYLIIVIELVSDALKQRSPANYLYHLVYRMIGVSKYVESLQMLDMR